MWPVFNCFADWRPDWQKGSLLLAFLPDPRGMWCDWCVQWIWQWWGTKLFHSKTVMLDSFQSRSHDSSFGAVNLPLHVCDTSFCSSTVFWSCGEASGLLLTGLCRFVGFVQRILHFLSTMGSSSLSMKQTSHVCMPGFLIFYSLWICCILSIAILQKNMNKIIHRK